MTHRHEPDENAPDRSFDLTALEHSGDGAIDLAAVEAQRDRIEELEEIIAFLVHELRNPLAVVKGFALALENATERLDEKLMRTSANAIRRNAENLGAFVDSLADVYSLTTDRLKLTLSETLISEMVKDTVDDLSPVLNGSPVEIHIEDDVFVSIDRVRVRQALTNLLTNAAKYAPGAPIEVIVTREDSNVEICVADRGPGIPREQRHALFKKFSRLDNGSSGMGIGLFISRGIARAHGGDLFLAPSDKGCRFVLHLPVRDGVDPHGA